MQSSPRSSKGTLPLCLSVQIQLKQGILSAGLFKTKYAPGQYTMCDPADDKASFGWVRVKRGRLVHWPDISEDERATMVFRLGHPTVRSFELLAKTDFEMKPFIEGTLDLWLHPLEV